MGAPHAVQVDDPDMPLLWVVRDFLGLTGTKYGCGRGLCGACTVHLDGVAIRSCSVPVSAAVGKTITTIEGLSPDGQHPLQRAWEEGDVPQCGYCQAGQLMQAARCCARNPKPTDAADHGGDVRQPLPLRNVSAHSPRHQQGQRVKRREFLRDSALVERRAHAVFSRNGRRDHGRETCGRRRDRDGRFPAHHPVG